MKSLRLLASSLLVVLSLSFAAISPSKALAAYNVGFANVPVGQITPGSGNVGVDIWWPANGTSYNPCQNDMDIYYGACATANSQRTSYYKYMSYSSSGNNFPYGIFIDNQNPNNCLLSTPAPVWCQNKTTAATINHGWGTLITGAALEIYPNDPTKNIGGLRAEVDNFPNFANGGRYSASIGNISLPQLGQSGVGKLNGFVTNHGTPVAAGAVNFDIFQNGSSRRSSTGYPLSGFSSVPTNSDGYYSTGAVPSGSYKIYITDSSGHKVTLDGVNINSAYERLDFQLDQKCFGHPGSNCTDPAS